MKVIKKFNLNTDNIPAGGEYRSFSIIGDKGAVFSLEIKNEDDYYYNFETNLFQATKTRLNNKKIVSTSNGAEITIKLNTKFIQV